MLCDDGLSDNYKKILNDPTTRHTTIEQLCDNILLEVFSHLNVKDLKNASLVARRWNELIGSSASTMRKFRFRIENEILENFGSKRIHQSFVVQTSESTDWTTIIGNIPLESVRTFHVQRSRFYDKIHSDEILTFLSRLTELEVLIFENVTPTDGTGESVQQIRMPKLKTLRIMGNDFSILRHINLGKLQHLQCIGGCNSRLTDFESIAESIVRFSHSKRAQSLTLWNCMESFEYIDTKQILGQFKAFEVYHINVSPSDVATFEANLRQFLLLHANVLRDLKFDCSMLDVDDGHQIVSGFLRIVFNKCTNLKLLDIRNLSIPRDGSFYQCLSANSSISHLKVHWGFDGEVIDALLQKCPRLTRLEADLCHLSGDAINSISTFCPGLTHLHTFKLTGCISVDAIFHHLKCLSIIKLENVFAPLLALVSGCPKLETIRIDECWSIESFPIEAIKRMPTVKKLIIADKRYECHADEDGRQPEVL